MLPTCIGISGVSRYRNDASIEDSFLASLMFSSRLRSRGALVALLAFRGPRYRTWVRLWHVLTVNRHWKPPPTVKFAEFALGLRQTIRQRPQGGRVHPQS